ncbi:MAG: type II secretion system F family protein [Ruminococcus sp.]|nr:type II secretion system F family protein [Ruminococcus sp.]
MPLYKYTAKDISGKVHKGALSAADPEALKKGLRETGLYLSGFTEKVDKNQGKKLKAEEISTFCREISTMLASGISLVRAMNIINNRDLTPKLKYAFGELLSSIKKGIALSDAMGLLGKTFPPMLINMVKAGEASGRLDETMEKMADYYEKDNRLNKSIRSALTYPIILAVLTVCVAVGLMTFVVPMFADIFDGMTLPLVTRIVMTISNALTDNFVQIVIVVAIVCIAVYFIMQIEKVRFGIDKLKLKMPVVGKLLKIIYTARFARTLASLYSSGLSIINALQISKDTIGNRYITQQFDEVVRSVRAGNSLSATLAAVDGFDKKLSDTIAVGEETGQLDSLLVSIADSYDYDSDMAIKRLMTMIEPLMIIILAFFVVVIMLAVLMPIFGMYSQIEQMGNV